MSRFARFIPLLLLLILMAVFAVKLSSNGGDKAIDNYMVGTKLADFEIPELGEDNDVFSTKNFAGNVIILNVFASWCVPCEQEHEVLLKLAETKNAKLYGLAWKNKPEAALEYLNKHKNPFEQIGVDLSGITTLKLGLSGVPETFIIDKNGVIAFHYKSVLTDEMVSQTILPLVEKLKNEQ